MRLLGSSARGGDTRTTKREWSKDPPRHGKATEMCLVFCDSIFSIGAGPLRIRRMEISIERYLDGPVRKDFQPFDVGLL